MKRLIFILIILAAVVGVSFWLGKANFWGDGWASYGGKTPAETLQLLIAALKADDIGLASRYFMTDAQGSAERWRENWRQAKESGRLPQIISLLERAEPNPAGASHSGDFKYVVRDKKRAVLTTIDMEFFAEKGVWKIESL